MAYDPTRSFAVSPAADLPALRDFLSDHLFHHVMQFWLTHGVDDAGGLNTCLRDDGSRVSRDKWLWSQWRAVWVFSTLYHQFGQERQWLDLAHHVFDFCRAHGWLASERGWALRLAHDGSVIDGYESIYVDGFAIYGLTAYCRATGSSEAEALARQTADALIDRLAQPHDQLPHFPYPIPAGARVHGIPMIFSLVLWELGQLLDEPRYRDIGLGLSREVFDRFYRPDRNLILERVAADGSELPPPLGTAVVPGHVIEDMWFQIHIARDQGDGDTIRRCCELVRRHLELGWDEQADGLLLAVDADGRETVGWEYADAKLWWPHTETLYALLLVYEQTKAAWCLPWYERVHRYSFTRYPSPHGEWVQKLDRQGRPFTQTVALPVKDPFHLPRALILSILALDRINAAMPATD